MRMATILAENMLK